jgi:hypothetical protein
MMVIAKFLLLLVLLLLMLLLLLLLLQLLLLLLRGHVVAWLRHYATSQKAACSIPDDVIGFFS